MPRPKSKSELLTAAESNFAKLFALIDGMNPELREATFSFEDRDKNLRDVLTHLYEWHMMQIKWIENNTSGNPAPFLPKPYNWKTYPNMNVELWKKHQKTPLDKAISILKQSHAAVMKLIKSFSDEELFEKKHFSWTGSTSLGAYCISSTSSHYDWAIKKLKRHIKISEARSQKAVVSS